MNNIDFAFKKEVTATPGGENLLNCYLCGSCTASCKSAELEQGFSPRKIMRMTLEGQKDALLGGEMIWLCIQCCTCTARCPQNAHPSDVIRALRTLAQEQGYRQSDLADRIEAADREGMKAFIGGVKDMLKNSSEDTK